ncbi:hypothetical protein Y1Q_0005013 [Alligator mississippiensis]|uniref:Uncharacterized protein n=1 Tax=Alligator mississippiensis TaxID=8496 RepID=A0A151MLD5_ALLMI|nr:hypothetical protein Y1Q_0005013 [Alligator mississippiensis]
MVLEDHLADTWAWQVEGMACEDTLHQSKAEQDSCKEAWDWTDQKFKAQLLALEHKQVVALWKQNVVIAWTVQVTDGNFQVLDTILALTVAFMPPAARLLTLAPPAPWQPPTRQEQALT